MQALPALKQKTGKKVVHLYLRLNFARIGPKIQTQGTNTWHHLQ